MFVKICGIRDIAALQAAGEAGADAVGFVFHRPSPRYVTPAEAIPLSTIAGRQRVKVGVFMDEPLLEVAGIADSARLDYVQVHAVSDPAAVKRMRSLLAMAQRPVGIILGVRLVAPDAGGAAGAEDGAGPAAEAGRAQAVEAAARLVRDSGTDMAIVEGGPAGHGRPWDWSLLRDLAAAVGDSIPLILAGGLTPANVAEAVRAARPDGVDVSSGVETDGRKDPDKIRAFVAAAKGVATVEPRA